MEDLKKQGGLDARILRGSIERVLELAEEIKHFSPNDWLYLLVHCPNNHELVGKCDKWDELYVEKLCDLLCKHPQLSSSCPTNVYRKFRRGHWARMIFASHDFAGKLEELGLKEEMVSNWCCAEHWAEEYTTIFNVRCAAAISEDEKIKLIAEGSALNPKFAEMGRAPRYSNDILAHLQWVASVASDFADMAAIAASYEDVEGAARYSLLAKAANYAARIYAR